jgi:hypothetical protein
MPYIEKSRRERFDWLIDNLAAELEANGITGNLNYVLYRLFLKYTKLNGMSYKNSRDFIGELECVKLELYRRKIVPYEQKKIKNNGDIYD